MNKDQEEPTPTAEHDDWSAPAHQPPQPYAGGTPATTGAQQDLETSEVIAVVAAVIPGVGQMLLGQTVKGLVLLGIALLTCSGFGLFSVASIVDTFLVAKAKHRRVVDEWEFFPDFQETFNL